MHVALRARVRTAAFSFRNEKRRNSGADTTRLTAPPRGRSVSRRMMSGLLRLSAHEAIALMRRGELKAEEYATALLARADALGHLNAFISLFPEQVMEAAQAADRHRAAGGRLGPLHGLPIPIKDSVNTADHPTTSGTAALRDFRPKDD